MDSCSTSKRMFHKAYLVLPLLVCTAWSRSPQGEYQPEIANCDHFIQRIRGDHVLDVTTDDLTGEWTSHRCEVRPGPEYLLRKYRFYKNGKFELFQYFYSTADCSEPIFSLTARGRVQLYGRSWIIPGASEMDYTLSYVTLMPYSQMIADTLALEVNGSCQGHMRSPWKPFERHEIYNFVEYSLGGDAYEREDDDSLVLVDRDCLAVLQLSFHELQLMQLEERQHQLGVRRGLFLGDIHTDRHRRLQYRPSSFQPPLYNYQMTRCPVCQAVSNSDEYYPPSLPTRAKLPLHLTGTSWTSTSCETRPHVLRLTRHIQFLDNATWHASYKHFYDARCQEPMFSLEARGIYSVLGASPLVTHSYNVDFYVNSVRVTAHDTRVTGLLNDVSVDACGRKGAWKLNHEQDVTDTKGCAPLGVTVPPVDPDLLMLRQYHQHLFLFMGQKETEKESRDAASSRPTSFLPPLVRCDEGALNQQGSVQISVSEDYDGFRDKSTLHKLSLTLFVAVIMSCLDRGATFIT